MTDINKVIEACETLRCFCYSKEYCGTCPANEVCGLNLPYGVDIIMFMKEFKDVLKRD